MQLLARAGAFWLVTILFVSLAQAETCGDKFAELDKVISEIEKRSPTPTRPVNGRVEIPGAPVVSKGICSSKSWKACLRDRLRYHFQTTWNNRDYPVVAADDYSTVKAYIIANDGVNQKIDAMGRAARRRAEAAKGEGDGVDIGDDLSDENLPGKLLEEANQTLKHVRGFRDRAILVHEKRLNLELQVPELELFVARAKAKDGLPMHSIEVELPLIQLKSPQSISEEGLRAALPENISWKKYYFGTAAQLENELKDMRRNLKELRGTSNWRGETDQLYLEQAISLKKIETYYHEITRAMTAYPQAELKPSVKEFYEAMKDLYIMQGGKPLKFRSEFNPGGAAWERLKWINLGTEIKSAFLRFNVLSSNERVMDRVHEIVENLSEREMRMLGLTDLARQDKFFRQSKWYQLILNRQAYWNFFSRVNWRNLGVASVPVVPAASALSYGAIASIDYVWGFLLFDERSRQECVVADPSNYGECLMRHLQVVFPEKFLRESMKPGSILDKKGNFIDKDILAEIALVKAKRFDHWEKENRYRSSIDAASKRLESSPDYQNKDLVVAFIGNLQLSKPQDLEKFRYLLLGDAQGDGSYIKYHRPFFFASIRPHLDSILALGLKPVSSTPNEAQVKAWEATFKKEIDAIRLIDTESAENIDAIYTKIDEVTAIRLGL